MSDSTEVAAVRAITVPFHGAELFVVEHNGQPYTPMKRIVSAMGLDWKSQHRKMTANEARWGITELVIPAATMVDSTMVGSADGKTRELTCIPVRKVAAWLTTIEPGKVKNPEVRARVIQYQNECDEVLWQYWNDGVAVNPRTLYSVNPGDVLSKDEAEKLRLMLKAAVDRMPKQVQGKMMLQGWSKLKAHFKVPYREIPRHEFSEAVSIIARHTAEWELVEEGHTDKTTLEVSIEELTQQVETGSSVAPAQLMPLVNAVLRKQGFNLGMPAAQSHDIAERIDRLESLFHPLSPQFSDVVGIRRTLLGLNPKLGSPEHGYCKLISA